MSVVQPNMKLTLINVYHEGKKHQEFIMCKYEEGRAVLSMDRLNKILDKLKVPRGGTYSVG